MRKWLLLMTLLLLVSLPSCTKEETPRQLFISTYKIGKVDDSSPAWFDPATGEVTYLCTHCPHQCQGDDETCSEEVHGDDCPFAGILRLHHVVEDTVYYFCLSPSEKDVHINLYAYSLTDGERTHLLDTVNTDVYSHFLFEGEYLYQLDTHVPRGQNNTNQKYISTYRDLQRLHLPTGTWEDVSGQSPPWQIEDGIGYYLLSESDDALTGMVSQPLYTSSETPPEETILFQKVTMDATPLLTEDAIYWIGDNKLPEDEDTVVRDLYRYDRQTQEITLLAQDFGSRFSALNAYLVEDDGYLYGICEEHTKEVLTQVCIADGTQKALYTEDDGLTKEDGWTIENSTLDMVEDYVIVDVYNKATPGKLVYDTTTGESVLYVLS